MAKFSIRFNTVSTSDVDRWRLIEDGKELLVSDVIVETPMYTTHDYIEGIGDKWHVTTEGICTMKGTVAHITKPKTALSIRRHLYKTITWRIIGSIDTMIVSWIITGNPMLGLKIGSLEIFNKMALYFLHERGWYIFGKNK